MSFLSNANNSIALTRQVSAAANTVVADDSKVYTSGGWPENNLLAIRTHTLEAGLLVAEIQQPSDTTFRLKPLGRRLPNLPLVLR